MRFGSPLSGRPDRVYSPAVIESRGRSGVYLIRDESGLRYVGESHSSRLYDTLTRHFQRWSDVFDTAGETYDPADVEVAIVYCEDPDDAPVIQNLLIAYCEPADNRYVPEVDDLLDDLGDVGFARYAEMAANIFRGLRLPCALPGVDGDDVPF